MNKWTFTIYGRGLGRELENPMGYHRTTVKSKWDPKHREYENWKSYVRGVFEKAFPDFEMQRIPIRGKYYNYAWSGKGLHIDDRFILRTWIYFVNDVRPDSGNVTKGIADALFDSDKQVLEQTMFYGYDKGEPRVTVVIEFESKKKGLNI